MSETMSYSNKEVKVIRPFTLKNLRLKPKGELNLDVCPLTDFERRFIEDEYLSKENANIPPSVGSLADRYNEQHFTEKVAKPYLMQYCPEAMIAHERGWIYIFKFPWCLLRVYCGSTLSTIIPKAGLKTHYTESKPPKHLDACIDQLTRTVIALSFEREGAVGLNEIDAALAPYLREDEFVNPKKFLADLVTKLGDVLNGNGFGNGDVQKFIAEFAISHTMKMLQQQVQRFFYTLNNIERPTIQSPFSNVSFAFTYSEKVLSELEVYYAGKKIGHGSDYLEEMVKVFKAFCLMYWVGDAKGRPFTFPIPTIIINDGRFFEILEKDPELWEIFWKVTAVRGSFYFQNTKDDVVQAFCCRLHCSAQDIKQRLLKTHGVWFKPGFVGSVDYIGLSLPRFALVAEDEAQLAEIIYNYMEKARKVLNLLRTRYKQFYKLGWYPVTKYLFEKYLEGNGARPEDFDLFDDFYFNTIAVIGIAEAASIWILKNRDDYARECDKEAKFMPYRNIGNNVHFRTVWKFEDGQIVREILRFYEFVLSLMRYIAKQFSEEDGLLYNIEQAPAESASVKIAKKDLDMFGKEIEPYIPRFVDQSTGKVEYFYTSQNTPPYCTFSIKTQIYIEAMTQPLFTGGVTKILQVHVPFYDMAWDVDPSRKREAEQSLERLAKLIRGILEFEPVEGRRVVYLAFTPVQNHCNSCGFVWVGDPYKTTDASGRPCCPKCGSTDIDTWSRIVGYYRPIRNWNPGRRAEFFARLRAAETWLGDLKAYV